MFKWNVVLSSLVACVPVISSGAGNDFKLGVEVFLEGHSHITQGKRVALLTNQSGLDSKGRSTIDLLFKSPNVNLVKLFSPEHGIRGKVLAGKHVDNSVDKKTGLPIISLYGAHGYRPKPEMLKGIDVVVYDIINSIQTGNWNDPTTWDSGTVPLTTESARVMNGHTVTVTANAVINNFIVQAGGTLNHSGRNLSCACIARSLHNVPNVEVIHNPKYLHIPNHTNRQDCPHTFVA